MLRTLQNGCLGELKQFLKGEPEELRVVVMPDFFLDRVISLNWNVKGFFEKLDGVVERKGGSLDGVAQTELRGGNAVNTASALASLGAEVTPIFCTDKLGLQLVKFHFDPKKVDFTHVKILGKPSITTAMEFKTKNGKANVMLRDVGALADFGPQHLNEEDFEAIENADYICVFNWAGTKRFGTELAKTVFRHTKTRGRGKTYYDTADPNPNKEKIPTLIKNLLQGRYVDVLSVNENEAICYASPVSDEVRKLRKGLRSEERAKEAARILVSHLSARVDLHTTSFSATFTKKGETVIPAFQVPVLRATGAGDAWNAGNILGDANGLADECRLTLANAVAAYYISNPKGAHPTRKQLMGFCEKLKGRTASPTSHRC